MFRDELIFEIKMIWEKNYLGMKMLWEEHISERSKIGRKLPRNELHQNITPSTHENILKGKHSGMNIQK